MSQPMQDKDNQDSYRAVVCHRYGGFEELELARLVRQPLLAHQVRIEVSYTGVSFAHSLVVAGLYQRKPPLPFTPGTEAAGIVTEVGADVSHVNVGDRVCAVLDWGGYAEEVVAHEAGVFRLPEDLPLVAAITLPISYATAYGALQWRARLQAGQSVLIYGAAGGVGLAAAEIARAKGAEVIAVVNGQQKLDALQARGFNKTIDAKTTDVREAVSQYLGNQGVHVVFDPIGGDVTHEALRCLGDDGRLLSIGYASGTIPQIPANILLLKNISVMGFNWGQYVGWGKVDERMIYAARVRESIEQLIDWWQKGLISPNVHETLPLGEFVQAMQLVKSRASVGRIVLDAKR